MAALIKDSYKIQGFFRDKSEFYKSRYKDKLTTESKSISQSKIESKVHNDESVHDDNSVDPF